MSLTIIIIIITVLVSFAAFQNAELTDKLIHHPYTEFRHKEYYRWLTSGFIHGGQMHLFINMFVFYQFGGFVERVFVAQFGQIQGTIYYLILYLGAIVFADLPSYYKNKNNSDYASLGASGGVSGIMFAYVLFAPIDVIYLYGIIPMYTVIWGVAYLAYEQWASRRENDGIGHDAHFYGAVFGIIFTSVMIPRVLPHFIEQITSLFN